MNDTVLSQKDAYSLMLKSYPDVMNIEQMCEVLSISTKTGYKLLKEQQIASLRIGKKFRIPKVHIFTYLKVGSPSSINN